MSFSPNTNGTELRNNEIEYGIISAIHDTFFPAIKAIQFKQLVQKKKKIPRTFHSVGKKRSNERTVRQHISERRTSEVGAWG